MSIGNVEKFYNEMGKDEDMQKKLGDLNEKTLTEEVFQSKVLPEAKAKGYDFTYAEVLEYYKKQSENDQLSIDELEKVSGGWGSKFSPDKAGVILTHKCDRELDFEPASPYFDWKNDKKTCKNCVYCKNGGGNKWYCALRAYEL